MAAAATKQPNQTTRFDIEKKFREEFGRDLTPEERRLLGWAEQFNAIETPATSEPKDFRKYGT
jgi:hypothetical protein